MAFLAVQRLRGTPAAERLKRDWDIDINTLPGIQRAIARAPQLAQAGYGEVSQAILGTGRRMFPRADIYEQALAMSGVAPEVAHQMATRPEDIARTVGVPPVPATQLRGRLDAMAGKVQATPEGRAVREATVRQDITDIMGADRTGVMTKFDELRGDVHRDMVNGWEGLTRAVIELLGAEVGGPAR